MPGPARPPSSAITAWDLPAGDLDAGVARSTGDLERLRGARLLVTGGTGFLGSWLVASLLRANELLGLHLHLVVLTRASHLEDLESSPAVTILRGDVRDLPDPGPVDIVLHGAASSSAAYGSGDGEPRAMARTIVEGTLRALDVAARNRARLLLLSSGAVYGPQVGPVAEDASTAPDPMEGPSAYGQAKRLAETLCAAAAEAGETEVVVARLFAFVGPRIPLDGHFAAGNFLRDAIGGRAIEVRGDGRPLRSYLYAGDLPEWCWALLARGRSGAAYNVGSPMPVTVAELARRVADIPERPIAVRVLGELSAGPASWYVPSTDRAERELGLRPHTDLDVALAKTFSWFAPRRDRRSTS